MAEGQSEGLVWSFGFGSNMNVAFVEKKKGIKVFDSVQGSVPGWRMSFTQGGMALVEPRYANSSRMTPEGEAAGETPMHGVALCLSVEGMADMDRQEGIDPAGKTGAYTKVEVDVKAYDGRTIQAWVYTARNQVEEQPCSRRYLNILVTGARDAQLDAAYIDALVATPTYTPSPETLALRKKLPGLDDLAGMTVEELASTKDDAEWTHVAIFGYVLRLPRTSVFFGSHRGRDLTARFSRQWRGISLDTNDDFGRPPFRLPADFDSDDEVEYVWQWLDSYLAKSGVEAVVAHVSEYREQEEAAASKR